MSVRTRRTNVPAFVPSQNSERLRNLTSHAHPELTAWQHLLRNYREYDDAQLVRLSNCNTPTSRDAASQVLLERAYNRQLEEDRELKKRERLVLRGLEETGENELHQSLWLGWGMNP